MKLLKTVRRRIIVQLPNPKELETLEGVGIDVEAEYLKAFTEELERRLEIIKREKKWSTFFTSVLGYTCDSIHTSTCILQRKSPNKS